MHTEGTKYGEKTENHGKWEIHTLGREIWRHIPGPSVCISLFSRFLVISSFFRQLYQGPFSKIFLAYAIVSGFGGWLCVRTIHMAESILLVGVYTVSRLSTLHYTTNKGSHSWERLIPPFCLWFLEWNLITPSTLACPLILPMFQPCSCSHS